MKANDKQRRIAVMKTVNIKGKEYVEVSERVKYFRSEEAYSGWSMLTEIIELTQERVVIRAVISDQTGREIATGIAYEVQSSSFINNTSFIENCETSAWGRALANLGIGIDASIASSLEVQNAITNQGVGEANVQSYNDFKAEEDEKPWLNDITELLSWASSEGLDAEQAIREARKKYKVSNKTVSEIRKAMGDNA